MFHVSLSRSTDRSWASISDTSIAPRTAMARHHSDEDLHETTMNEHGEHTIHCLDHVFDVCLDSDEPDVIDLTMSSRSSSPQTTSDTSITVEGLNFSSSSSSSSSDIHSPSRRLSLTEDDARRLFRNKRVLFAGDESLRILFRDLAQSLEDGQRLGDVEVNVQDGEYQPIRGRPHRIVG